MSKRPHSTEGTDSDSDSDGVDFPSASASSTNKRARLASLPASTPPPIPSDAEDTPATDHQYKQEDEDEEEDDDDDDGDADELDTDDEDAQMREQAKNHFRKKASQSSSKSSKVAQAGVIESVTLHNFMCHKFSEVLFGPQINFLVGHNGSGKSAVLTGISMALGGNAKASNRAGKQGGLVKDGEQVAICTVKLKNQGPDAYKPEVFGKSIIIERRINRTLGGGYKIKDWDGKRTIDTTKGCLDNVLDHFNIQVDNPMTVLTQDMSRQFLAQASAKDKYNFFLRGTQLAQLTEDYEMIRVRTEDTEATLEKKKEILPELKELYKRAKHRAQEAQAALGQRERVDVLKNELTWSYVAEVEEKLEEGRDTIEKEERYLPKLQAKLVENQAKMEEADGQMATVGEAQREALAGVENTDDEKNELLRQISQIKDELKNCNNEERKAGNELKILEDRVNQYSRDIAAEQSRLHREANKERGTMLEKVQSLEEEQAKVSVAAAKFHASLGDIDDEERSALEEYRQLREKIDNCQKTLTELEGKMKTLERSRGDTLFAFHDRMPQLVNAIKSERGWSASVPLGPIGSFIKLKDMKFNKSLESVFGATLSGFAVENERDKVLLNRLMKQVGVFVPILKMAPDPTFDCSAGEPSPDILTIRRVLEIQNRFLDQILVTSTHIEKAALVYQRAEGDNLLRTRPRNIETCFSADMFRLNQHNGGSSSTSLDAWHGQQRLSPDVSGQIRAQQDELNVVRGHLENFVRERHELDTHLRNFKQQKREVENQGRNMAKKVAQLNKEIDRLREELSAEEPSNLAALEEAKADAEGDYRALANQSQGFAEEKRRLHDKQVPLVQRRTELDSAAKKAANQANKFSEMLEALIQAKEQARVGVHQLQKKVETQQAKIAQLLDDEQKLKEVLEERIEKAQSICDRPIVEKKKSINKLTQEIEMIQKALKEREKRQGATVEQIMEEVTVRKEAAEKAITEVNGYEKLCAALNQAYSIRLDRWMDFRDTIATRAKLQFFHHLQARGFGGKLSFDHEKGRLNLRVQPNADSNNKGPTQAKQKDAKSLSGGEKSFSTICLLLTMWESVGCPIRCLDEFDVFMDAVNRRVSMKLIIDTAKDLAATQFILITPQAMGTMTWGPEVRVSKMQDPGRNHGTLQMDA